MEIKALPELDTRSVGQLLNYLKVAGGGVGLLLNFGAGLSSAVGLSGTQKRFKADQLHPLHATIRACRCRSVTVSIRACSRLFVTLL